MMKKTIEERNKLKSPKLIISKRLEKYDNLPLFQKKLDKVNAFLAEYPLNELLREKDNKQIKLCFEQGLSIEQIAQQVELPKAEVLLRLKEMGLIEPVAV